MKLDGEAWDRLITWIDLNVPDHGTWHEHRGASFRLRRAAAARCEPGSPTGRRDPGRRYRSTHREPVEFVKPQPVPKRKPQTTAVSGLAVRRRRGRSGSRPRSGIDAANG